MCPGNHNYHFNYQAVYDLITDAHTHTHKLLLKEMNKSEVIKGSQEGI